MVFNGLNATALRSHARVRGKARSHDQIKARQKTYSQKITHKGIKSLSTLPLQPSKVNYRFSAACLHFLHCIQSSVETISLILKALVVITEDLDAGIFCNEDVRWASGGQPSNTTFR